MFAHGDGVDDVGAADDADDFAAVHHRQAFDLVLSHQLSDLFNWGVFVNADYFLAHDRFDIFALLGNDVRFGDDADDLAIFTSDGRAADLILDERHRQLPYCQLWRDGNDVLRHNLFGDHVGYLLESLFSHQFGQVADAATVTPFVVVPTEYFGHFAFEYDRRHRVDNRGCRITTKIAGNQGLVAISQDAFHCVVCSLPERVINRLDGRSFLEISDEIDYRDCRGRHAQRQAVKLAFELGHDQPDRLCRAGAGRHNVHRGG